MNNSNGAIWYSTAIDNAGLRQGRNEAKAIWSQMEGDASAAGMSVQKIWQKAGVAIGGYLSIQAASQFVRQIVQVRGEIQGLGLAFETMLGSKAKADKMMADVIDFAQKTPFTVTEVASNVKQIIAMNAAGDDVMKTFKTLGDVAAGVNVPISRIAINFGQVAALGKLQSREIRDFAMAGIPIVGELAKMYGVAEDEIMGMVEAGKIGFPEVQKAFEAMAGSGGKFNNMMEKLNSTVSGQMSRLQDQIEQMFNKIGAANEGVIYGAISGATYLVENYEKVGKILAELVATYGAYRAALISINAINATVVTTQYAAEAASLYQLLSAEQKAAISKKGLSATSEEYFALVKLETAANVQAAESALVKARADVKAAIQAVAARRAEYIAAKQLEAQRLAELMSIGATGTKKQVEIATRKLSVAETKRETAAIAWQSTTRDLNAKKTVVETAARTANTVASGVNTAAETANATATGILTTMKNQLIATTKRLTAAMLKNPWALAAAAVAALAFGIYKLVTYQTEAEKTTKKLNDAIKDGESARDKEIYQIDVLFERLKAAKKGTDEYRAAKDAIMSKYGQYLKSLGDEKTALDDIAKAYRTIITEATNAANARAIDLVVEQSGDLVSQKYSDAFDDIEKMLIKKFGEKTAAGYMVQLTPVLRGTGEMTSELEAIIEQFDKTMYSAGSPTIGGGGAYSYTVNTLRTQITELAKVRSAADESINNAIRKFGPQQNEGNEAVAGFDAIRASIEELAKELPNAKAKLEALIKAGDDQDAINKQQALVDTINAQIQARIKAGQTSKAYWESEKTRITGELDGLKEIDRQGEKGAKLRAELASVDQRLQTWNTKVRAETEEQGKDLADLRTKLASDSAQAEIDAMDDGFAKRMAQLRRNHELEKAGIEANYTELARLQDGELTTEQQRQKTFVLGFVDDKFRSDAKAEKDAVLADMMTFKDKYQKIITDTNAKIKDAQMAGATLDRFGVLSDQENEAINRLAEEYAAKSADYEAFMRLMVGASEEEINTQIDNARALISQIIEGGIGDEEVEKYLEYKARLNSLKDQLKNDKTDTSPEKESERDWKKLYSTLQKVEKEFNEIGDSIGGTAGEAIKLAGTVASSTISMINGIKTVTGAAAASMTALEKASVILAVVGAAMQVVQALTGFFKSNDQALRDAADSAREYNAALKEIRTIQRYDLFDTVFGENALGKFKEAKDIAIETLEDIQEQVKDVQNRTQTLLGKVTLPDAIEATYDGRSGFGKLFGTGRKSKIKTYVFDINDFINSDGSLKLDEIKKWYEAYQDGLDEAEKRILEDLIANGEAFNEAVEVQTEYMKQLWGDLASSIADNMIEAFLETGDAASNLEDLVADVAKNMAKSMIVDELMSGIFNDDLQNKLSNLLKSGNQTGANNLIKNAIESAGQLAPYFESIMESVGLVAGVAEDAANEARTSASQGFAQASQDSIDKIDGILTNGVNILYDIRELMKSSVPGGGGSSIAFANIEAPVNNIAEMMRTNRQIQQANTDNILGRLTNIDMNTRPIAEMQKDIHYMRGRTDDMADSLDKFTRG